MTSERFTGILSCIEIAMKTFGDSFAQVIFWNLERSRGVTKEGMVDNPEALRECLSQIFGSGSKVVEQHIVSEIQNRFNLPSDERIDCVSAIQRVKKQVLLVSA